jgi:putative DNA methylase
MPTRKTSLIETDNFPFEFLSRLGERESWRKDIHRPVYHIHKWWAKRLGSVFRGILLGCILPKSANLSEEFYNIHTSHAVVFDPFMGSGTTVGEAHKLNWTVLGRDINPVAVKSVQVALGPLNQVDLENAFAHLSSNVGETIRRLYHSKDSKGRDCDVLYFFWVMQAPCPTCNTPVDLFSSWIIARNAHPDRKPDVQVLCPACGHTFRCLSVQPSVTCPSCSVSFDPSRGSVRRTKATCSKCKDSFSILKSLAACGTPPTFRLYAKLILTENGKKEYLPATVEDLESYHNCRLYLEKKLKSGELQIPTLALEDGYNTRQAMRYNFNTWRDFFNSRQLLALSLLHRAICEIPSRTVREPLLVLFSGILEFQNMFASYKGEGTGAVRHMFANHILKPERTPIEANVWGTPKSSGAFSTLFRSRLIRAIQYRLAPTELNKTSGAKGRVCSQAFTGEIEANWPCDGSFADRGVYLSCGDSSRSELPDSSVDFVVTDPPFFDNVHYSELADFFFSWQQLSSGSKKAHSTRHPAEVQDSDADRFASKLLGVFRECHRILKDEGLLVFTYHHSRDDGWIPLAEAILGSGFAVVNSHPVKSELSTATPKSQAREPIQLDMVLVCRKQHTLAKARRISTQQALTSAYAKIERIRNAGVVLSRNDRKVVLFGQLLQTLNRVGDSHNLAQQVQCELDAYDSQEQVMLPHLA